MDQIKSLHYIAMRKLLFILAIAFRALMAQPAAETLELAVGETKVIDCDWDIVQISTSAPEIVDTVAINRREVLLQAKGQGLSTVGLWSRNGQRALYRVTVTPDMGQIRELLRRTFPGEQIEVHAAGGAISLTGRASSAAVAERAAALVAPMAKNVVNNLEVAAPAPEKQVMLKVKFAELNRSAFSSIGVNILSTGALNTSGRVTTGQFSPPAVNEIFPRGLDRLGVTGATPGNPANQVTNFTLNDALNVFAFRPDLNLGAMIEALRSRGVLQILAEPNLIATENKEASFLVGGEFPIPVVSGTATLSQVTIVFKEFGIRLSFQPQLTANRTIRLHVKPEVSTIDMNNAVTMNGFTVPALSTRRVETDIELAEGQSFVIAGLMDDRATEAMSRIPGLSSLPVLGALFKSREERKTKTELVVIVTPSIIDPASPQAAVGPVMPLSFIPSSQPEAGKKSENGREGN